MSLPWLWPYRQSTRVQLRPNRHAIAAGLAVAGLLPSRERGEPQATAALVRLGMDGAGARCKSGGGLGRDRAALLCTRCHLLAVQGLLLL